MVIYYISKYNIADRRILLRSLDSLYLLPRLRQWQRKHGWVELFCWIKTRIKVELKLLAARTRNTRHRNWGGLFHYQTESEEAEKGEKCTQEGN